MSLAPYSPTPFLTERPNDTMNIIHIILEYHTAFTKGIIVTLKLSLIIWCAGLVIGGATGFLSTRLSTAWDRVAWVIGFLILGTPVLVILMWLNYPAQILLGVQIKPFYVAAFGLSAVNVVAVASSVRGALREFPSEYIAAGSVYGLKRRTILYHIQLPLLLRRVAGPLLLIQVYMLQSTLFASLISVGEIFRVAQEINSRVYQPVAIYTTLAIFFLLLCLPLGGVGLWLQQRYRHILSER